MNRFRFDYNGAMTALFKKQPDIVSDKQIEVIFWLHRHLEYDEYSFVEGDRSHSLVSEYIDFAYKEDLLAFRLAVGL
jgi:hypothetical protein